MIPDADILAAFAYFQFIIQKVNSFSIIARFEKLTMYPNLYYLFKDVFGWNLPALRVANTFGFCVSISFLVAAWLLVKELKRKQAAGYFSYKEITIVVGKPASIIELLVNFFLGFI